MKKSTKLLSVILAIVMLFSSFGVTSFAAMTKFNPVASDVYDGNDKGQTYLLTDEQRANYIMDMLDGLLKSANLDMGTIAGIRIDLRSIDAVGDTLNQYAAILAGKVYQRMGTVNTFYNVGIIAELNLEGASQLDRDGGRSDVANIASLIKVLNDSAVRIGEVFTKGASLGKIAIAGVDIPAITGNIPGFLKRLLAPLSNFYINFGEDANPAYPNKIAPTYTNDAAGYNQADSIVLDTLVKDILVKLLTMPRKGVYITDKAQNKFSADVANAKFVHTEKVVDIKGKPVLNEQGIQVENFYVYLDTLGNAVESSDQNAVTQKYTKRYLERWDPNSVIDANFDKSLIDFKNTSLLKLVNTFAPEIFNQLAYPALNGVLRWTLLKWAGVAVHNITQLDAAGKFTPEHTAAYNAVKPYLDMGIAQFENLANTDPKVSGTQEWLFVEIDGVKYQVYAPSKKQDSVSIATYTADPATTTAIYDLGNWDYQIGKWESLYTWDSGVAVENINIVPHASDIIGKIITAALPKAPWVMADNNAQASQNLNGLVKYILKADPIKIFGEGTVLPAGFDNFTTEQTLVTITKILINKLLPTVTLGDDVTTLEECAVYAIREFTADILPQFGQGWDAKIAAAKTNPNKDDAFLDILLNMGASIGVYYLREFIGFGSVNNNGAIVSTAVKYGPDFTWEVIFNDILNWFLTSYAKGLTSTLRSSANYTAAMSSGNAKALVNTIVNTLFPTEIKLLARPDEATFDFTTFFADFRALLNGEITTLFSRLSAKPNSLEGKGIADIVVAFLNDIVVGTGLGGDPHWSQGSDCIMVELNKAAATATPLNSLVTKDALKNIVRNLIYVLNGKQSLWIQDALTLIMMFTGAVGKMQYKGASQILERTSYNGAANFTVNGTFTMNSQGIIEKQYSTGYRTGKTVNGAPYEGLITRVVVESKDGTMRTETPINAVAAANQVVAFTAAGVAVDATKLYTVTTYYKVKLPDGAWLGGGTGTELKIETGITADSRVSDKEGRVEDSATNLNGRIRIESLSKIWYIDENMAPQSAQQNPALKMRISAVSGCYWAELNMSGLLYEMNAEKTKYVYTDGYTEANATWAITDANSPAAASQFSIKVKDTNNIVPFHNKAMYDNAGKHLTGGGAWSEDLLLWDVDPNAKRETFPSDFTSFTYKPDSLRTSFKKSQWTGSVVNAPVTDANERAQAESTIIMFNSYGLNNLLPFEIKMNRSAKDYTPTTWAAYEKAFNDALTLVYGPRDYKTFIKTNHTDNGNVSKFKAYSTALDAAIKGLVAVGKGGDAAGTMTEEELLKMEQLRSEVTALSKGITSYRDYALYSYKKFEKEYKIVVDAADWVAKPSGVAPNKLVNDAMSDAEITSILNGITDPKLKTIATALKTAPTAKETLDAQNRLDNYLLKPPTVNVNDITVARGNAERYKNTLIKGSYDRYYLTEAVNKAKAAVAGANANLYTPESVALLNKTIATAEACPVLQSEHQANRYYVLRALKNLVPVGKEASFTELNNAIAKAKSYLALIDTTKPVTKASADLLAALGLKVNYTDGAGVAQTYFIGGDTCAVSVAEHKGEYSAIKSQAYVDAATERINVALRNMFALIPEKDTQNQDKSTVAQNDLIVAGVNPSTIMNANELKALVKLENIPAGINATIEADFSSNGGAMGTGTKLNVKVGTDTALTYALVIYGDINGDGNIDGLDAFASNKIVNSFKNVTGAYAKAADTNSDGMINATDYAAINGELAGTAIAQKK